MEAALYFSDEVFDPESYNENSFKRESKIAIQSIAGYNNKINLEL